MDDLQKARKALGSVTAGPISGAIVKALADEWRDTAKKKVPVDTGQLKARIAVTTASSRGAVIVADTPYAGYVEYGTRYQPPKPYFRAGRDAAKDASNMMGRPIGTELARAINSGGVFNPRNVKWSGLSGI